MTDWFVLNNGEQSDNVFINNIEIDKVESENVYLNQIQNKSVLSAPPLTLTHYTINNKIQVLNLYTFIKQSSSAYRY